MTCRQDLLYPLSPPTLFICVCLYPSCFPLLPGFVLPWAASPCMTQSLCVDRTCSLSRECVSHEERHSRAKLTVPCCLLRCLTCFRRRTSPPPLPQPLSRSMSFPATREFLAVVRFSSFIVRYCRAVLCSPRDRHRMTMMLEDEVEWGGGGRSVSRDRPRCPVLHCRSAVRRRPSHRYQHVWLETEAGRDTSFPCPSVLRITFALFSSGKVRGQILQCHDSEHFRPR